MIAAQITENFPAIWERETKRRDQGDTKRQDGKGDHSQNGLQGSESNPVSRGGGWKLAGEKSKKGDRFVSRGKGGKIKQTVIKEEGGKKSVGGNSVDSKEGEKGGLANQRGERKEKGKKSFMAAKKKKKGAARFLDGRGGQRGKKKSHAERERGTSGWRR